MYPSELRTAELAATEKMADYTQPDPAVSLTRGN